MGAGSKGTCSHSQIRWMAIAMTPWSWVIGIVVLTQRLGQPLSHAAMVAAVGALSGLITWAIYHAISRRNDGLGLFIIALVNAVNMQDLSVRAAVVVQIAVGLAILSLLLVFIPLLGKLLRIAFVPLIRVLFRRPRVDDGQATHSPLSDPEVDQPLTK